MTRFMLVMSCTAIACSSVHKSPAKPAPSVWEDPEYCAALAEKDFWYARKIAEEKHLGRPAIQNAARLEMWKTADGNDYPYMALKIAEETGLSKQEVTAFAQKVFDEKVKQGRCTIAAEVAFWFDLGRSYLDVAIECEVRKAGIVSALGLACAREAHRETIDPLRRRFLNRFEIELIGDQEDFKRKYLAILEHCTFADEDYAWMFEKLLDDKNYDLPSEVLYVAQGADVELPLQEMWRRLFRKAAGEGRMDEAAGILRQASFMKGEEDFQFFITEGVKRFECVKAVQVAHENSLGADVIEGIFREKKCAAADFSKLADIVGTHQGETEYYFQLALNYQKYNLAWILAGRLGRDPSRYGSGGPHNLVIDEACRAGAYAVIIGFKLPPGMSLQGFREKILDRALDDSEEWFVVSYVDGQADEPTERWVERAFLRAMERGEYLLAAQIAGKFGKADRLEARGKLAFEMAMLAEKPKDAQFILQVTGLKDEELAHRAVLLRFRQKQKEERTIRRTKKKRERKDCLESDEWSVRCD